MRHVWGFATALGLLVFVIFGTWACLAAGGDKPDPTALILAVVGVLLMVIGVIGRGRTSEAITKARSVLGAIGLVVAAVTGFLTLFAVFTDPPAAIGFLVVTVVAIVVWAQGIAAQADLSVRMALAWLIVLVAFIGGALVLPWIGAAIVIGWLGLDSPIATRLVYAVVVALIGLLAYRWTVGRSDRTAVFAAVGRLAVGRRVPEDAALLAAGPVPIFRRQSPGGPV